MKAVMLSSSWWMFSGILLSLNKTHAGPLPSPQLIVKSQSNLFSNQPGRQIDLSEVLPTEELFWLNLEEGYFACQLNESEKFLKIFKISRLCDYKEDCYQGSDELYDELRCSTDCDPPCLNGVCLSSRPESQCHCDDGWGGKLCEEPDLNECKYRPCSLFAHCTNTLGSFYCTCRPGYQGDGMDCSPEMDPLQTTHVFNNDTDVEGVEGVGRGSICTYNGVEYLEGEEVFTQRRCNECVCRNGEIRCETVDCDQDPSSPGRECSGPSYLCNKGPEVASTPRYPVDVGDDSRFDDVINNVKNLIGGIDRTTTDSIVVSVSETSTPSIISFKTSTKASVPTLDVMKNVDDDDSKPSTNNFIAMMLDILDDASTEKTNNEPSCDKDCEFSSDDAIVFSTTPGNNIDTRVTTITTAKTRAPADIDNDITRAPVVTNLPGTVQVSLTKPSPRYNESDFEPITQPQEPDVLAADYVTDATSGIAVETNDGIMINNPNIAIEINFPMNKNQTNNENVSVKYTFGEEKDEDNEINDNPDSSLYDIVTESFESRDPSSTTLFTPPPFDSLPMFDVDIFAPTEKIEDNLIATDMVDISEKDSTLRPSKPSDNFNVTTTGDLANKVTVTEKVLEEDPDNNRKDIKNVVGNSDQLQPMPRLETDDPKQIAEYPPTLSIQTTLRSSTQQIVTTSEESLESSLGSSSISDKVPANEDLDLSSSENINLYSSTSPTVTSNYFSKSTSVKVQSSGTNLNNNYGNAEGKEKKTSSENVSLTGSTTASTESSVKSSTESLISTLVESRTVPTDISSKDSDNGKTQSSLLSDGDTKLTTLPTTTKDLVSSEGIRQSMSSTTEFHADVEEKKTTVTFASSESESFYDDNSTKLTTELGSLSTDSSDKNMNDLINETASQNTSTTSNIKNGNDSPNNVNSNTDTMTSTPILDTDKMKDTSQVPRPSGDESFDTSITTTTDIIDQEEKSVTDILFPQTGSIPPPATPDKNEFYNEMSKNGEKVLDTSGEERESTTGKPSLLDTSANFDDIPTLSVFDDNQPSKPDGRPDTNIRDSSTTTKVNLLQTTTATKEIVDDVSDTNADADFTTLGSVSSQSSMNPSVTQGLENVTPTTYENTSNGIQVTTTLAEIKETNSDTEIKASTEVLVNSDTEETSSNDNNFDINTGSKNDIDQGDTQNSDTKIPNLVDVDDTELFSPSTPRSSDVVSAFQTETSISTSSGSSVSTSTSFITTTGSDIRSTTKTSIRNTTRTSVRRTTKTNVKRTTETSIKSTRRSSVISTTTTSVKSSTRTSVKSTRSSVRSTARTSKSTSSSVITSTTRSVSPVNRPVQPRRDDAVTEECVDMTMPLKFYSFSGREAHNIADCSWDFFRCTERYGTWPDNKVCCEERFSRCSMLVMGMAGAGNGPNVSEDDADSASNNTVQNNSDQSESNKFDSGDRKDGTDLRSKEINCIWRYMNCSGDSKILDGACSTNFKSCSNSLKEDEARDWKGLPLPNVSGLNIIDLDAGSENDFSTCILKYYNCSNTLNSCRQEFNTCQDQFTSQDDEQEPPRSRADDAHQEAPSKPTQMSNSRKKMKVKEAQSGTGDVYTPSLSQGSGKIPEIQCTWSFFMCKKSDAECRQEHSDCLNGDVFDNKICAGVSQDPQRYLVPHPTDCTKFYSCQRNGWGGWIANLMDCPVTTGFDSNLMICNYINKLPRCQVDVSRTYSRSDQDADGLISKQTQQKFQLEVGEIGYYSSSLETQSSASLTAVNVTLMMLMGLILSAAQNL